MTIPNPTYTAEQARAIDTRDVSVALSAGAGCGKTFVLTERFLAHLDPQQPEDSSPADLSELVAITFTDRAAREMRDRIRRKCYERLQSADRAHAGYWLGLLRALDRARVSTIHSFCASLLRSNAVEAQLDPQFAVFEQAQAETFTAEVIDDCLRDRLAARDERTLALAAELGLDQLRRCITTLLDARREIDFQYWLVQTPEAICEIWGRYHAPNVLPSLLRQLEKSTQAAAVLNILRDAEVQNDTMRERMALLLDQLPRLSKLEGKAQQILQTVREAAKVQGAGGANVWPDEETYDRFKSAATKLRQEIDKARSLLDFDPATALPAAEVGLDLLRLTADVVAALEARKREVRALDFNDLLIRSGQLLTDPQHKSLRQRLAAQTRLLLVDEFQDTDPLQVELVRALCGGEITAGKLFFVGDFKQSIYGFRGARPQVFRDLKEETPPAGRLRLTLNFRSQPAILDFVNALFDGRFADEHPPLRPHRPQATATPAVEFLWAGAEGAPREKGATDEMRRREADWIARRIRSLLDAGEPLVGIDSAEDAPAPATRPVEPGDIAILFRALSNVQFYEEALRRYEIDYYLVGGHAFYAQQEVFDLLNLLRAVASPADEISLAGALRSPFFSLADAALYWLAQHEGGLSAGLFADPLPRELDDESRRRARAAAETLAWLRTRKDRMPIADLIRQALARTGYDAVLLAEFLGERKLANLRKLLDDARNFDRSGVFALSDFIVQLSQFVAEQPREPLAATHPESTDVVRLMTIHQAKGLEFPVVVVPDLERGSHSQGAPIAFTPLLGPLVRLGDEGATTGYRLYEVVSREEDQAEMVRLFYVACTRAADYLILASGIYELDKPTAPWTHLLAERFDLESGRYVDELPDGFTCPEVKVTKERPPTERKAVARSRGKDLQKLVQRAIDLAASGEAPTAAATEPLSVDASARQQYSFSRLTGLLHGPIPRPTAESEEPPPALDPLGLGSLTHAILEEMDFGGDCDVAAAAARIAPRHADDHALAGAASEMVARFLQSDRAAELAQAKQLYRELEFLLAWPPGEAKENGLYLQGYIDCLYQDAQGRWHILDYKTNRVGAAELAEVAEGYEMQLYVYALAAEQVLGEPPHELVLHFLQPGLEHRVVWDAAARTRVTQLVNQAIASRVESVLCPS